MSFCGGCGSAVRTSDPYCAACGLKLGGEPESPAAGVAERLIDLALGLGTVWLQNKIEKVMPPAVSQPDAAPASSELPEEFRTRATAPKAADPTYGEAEKTIQLADELRRTEQATCMANMVMESNRRMWDNIMNNFSKIA
jgi:hypothetical protein